MVKKENSQNIEEIIKKSVRAEIQNIFEGSINKDEHEHVKPARIPRNQTAKLRENEVNENAERFRTCYDTPKENVICDCGKYITKFTKQQKEMHSKSKFHIANI